MEKAEQIVKCNVIVLETTDLVHILACIGRRQKNNATTANGQTITTAYKY